jgi:uncharacterized phosphosugar-binding protein
VSGPRHPPDPSLPTGRSPDVSGVTFFDEAIGRLERLRQEEAKGIRQAAELCADSIIGEGLVFVFGTGHGAIPALEAFPRSGSVVGFRPMVELPITMLYHVWGDMGVPQYRFLHRQEGYGQAIVEANRLRDGDSVIVFSHSGINPVGIDIAVAARKMGLPLVGVTSREHSSQVESRHSSAKRLYELADVVIDTGAPLGDAVVRIDGLEEPVSAVSTVLVVAVMQAIIAETARVMVERGTAPHVEMNLNLPRETSVREHNDHGYQELWRRLANR